MDSYSKDLDNQILAINGRLIRARALLDSGKFNPAEESLIRKMIKSFGDTLDTLFAIKLMDEKQL